jgi:phosphatidate cytidylyltransferase
MKRDMRQSVVTGVILGAVALFFILVNAWTTVALVLAVALMAIWELNSAFKKIAIKLPTPVLWVSATLLVLSAVLGRLPLLILTYIICCVAVMIYTSFESDITVRNKTSQLGIFILTYIPFLISFYVLIRLQSFGEIKTIMCLLAVSFSDIGGMLAGMKFGKHKMCPQISPKKTWEGAVGSLLFSSVATAIFLYFAHPAVYHTGKWWMVFVVAAIAVVAGTFGDLAESLMKREIGIKDMSNLFPGHGGLLDRLDSLILTAPLMYYVVGLLM